MESAWVRGCVDRNGTGLEPGRGGRQADASRRRNGPRKTAPHGVRRSRCGLEVSPAVHASSDTAPEARRRVVAEKLRESQQGNGGSKTRSAGRAPSMTAGRAGARRLTHVDKGRLHGRRGERSPL